MKIRIAILLFITALMIGGSLWAATLTTAQDYKPTPGGPVWLCPQFGDGACGWLLVTETPTPPPPGIQRRVFDGQCSTFRECLRLLGGLYED